MLRIAHLSDLHFYKPCLSVDQFFSKRWLGNLNAALFRNHHFHTELLQGLAPFLQELQVNQVILSGDLTTTAFSPEFAEAKEFAKSLSYPLHLVPGNHDNYTQEAYRQKLFYTYFPSDRSRAIAPFFTLALDRVEARHLNDHWTWLGLDTSLATSLFSSNGYFFKSQEEKLIQLLERLHNRKVILTNHFPLFPHGKPSHDLERWEYLADILKRHPQVKFYLHGHVHNPFFEDRRREGLPCFINSGSATYSLKPTFAFLECEEKKATLSFFEKDRQANTWHSLLEQKIEID